MKRFLSLVFILVLLVGAAYAAPLEMGDPFEDSVYYPEDSDAQTASYRYTYRFPQIIPQNESDVAINEFFAYQMTDMLSFTAPLLAQEAEGMLGVYTQIDYQITLNNDSFFSVLFHQEQFWGTAAYETWTGHVFARTGNGAGMVLTLADVLGLSSPEDDESLNYDRATKKANELIYALVWEEIERQMANPGHEYFENLTIADLKAEFYPEDDFYMDEQGDLVFYIQPSMVATAAAGILTFPMSIQSLLDEL